MPTRSYYAVTHSSRWARLVRRLRPRRDYTGWAARALTDRDVPAGTVGRVLAARRRGGELVHVIGFPGLTVHAPLPCPGVELIEPGNAVRSAP